MNLTFVRGWKQGQVSVLTASGMISANGYTHPAGNLAVTRVSGIPQQCWTITQVSTGRWVGCFVGLSDAVACVHRLLLLSDWSKTDDRRAIDRRLLAEAVGEEGIAA